MRKSIVICITCFLSVVHLQAQYSFTAITRDGHANTLPGTTASISSLQKAAMADSNGLVTLRNIPAGKFNIVFSHVGFKEQILSVQFPRSNDSTVVINLEEAEQEESEVLITVTRSSRSIANIPSRVETISGEELEEKGNMKPGDIRMMLNESTGIQTQQTSATSYNSSIRIQGLDGKYTQIIRDGFPLYAGFSGGLGLLQIVPLDLKQVEVIKGSSSTLYGGGAIAGLVNLVSRKPTDQRQLNFLLNGTSAAGLDASGFYSQKKQKAGIVLFASYNHGSPYDPANTGLTAIPKFNRFTFNPKLFLYFSKKTTADFGINTTIENRVGGDMNYINGKADSIHSYFEKNKTNRYSTQLTIEHIINEHTTVKLKNSESYYRRSVEIPDYLFAGEQLTGYTEATLQYKNKEAEWIGGISFTADRFTQDKNDTIIPVNYRQHTTGIFVQHTRNLSRTVTMEAGLRGDYQDAYGFFLLPRISLLYRISEQWSLRAGGGMGYKAPNVFTEDAERIQFKQVLPIDPAQHHAEKSYGGNADFNYRTTFSNHLSISINQLFFYTRINHPLVLTALPNGFSAYQQPAGFIDTKGMETNLKLTCNRWKLFIGYTLSDVKQHYATTRVFPLVARHRLNNVLMYEVEDKLKAGLEAYYYSPQQLSDGTTGKAYWLTGLMAEKLWEHVSLFVNFENFSNTRQTKFEPIFTGTITHPVFRDIYAPVDGFVLNGGIKLKL